jgi:hypothetical protein
MGHFNFQNLVARTKNYNVGIEGTNLSSPLNKMDYFARKTFYSD